MSSIYRIILYLHFSTLIVEGPGLVLCSGWAIFTSSWHRTCTAHLWTLQQESFILTNHPLFHFFHIIIYINVSISLQWMVIPFSSTIRGTPLDSVKGNEHSTQVTVSCSTGRQPLFERTFIYKYLPHLLTY